MRIRSNEEHFTKAEEHCAQQEELRQTTPPAIGIYAGPKGQPIIPQGSQAAGVDELKTEMKRSRIKTIHAFRETRRKIAKDGILSMSVTPPPKPRSSSPAEIKTELQKRKQLHMDGTPIVDLPDEMPKQITPIETLIEENETHLIGETKQNQSE